MDGIHGGARPGAGRKPDLSTQLERAEKLAKQLQKGLRRGLDQLAEDYPDLMRKAIEMARGGDTTMLSKLLALLPSMVKLDDEDMPPMAKLLQKWAVEGDIKVKGTMQVAAPEDRHEG